LGILSAFPYPIRDGASVTTPTTTTHTTTCWAAEEAKERESRVFIVEWGKTKITVSNYAAGWCQNQVARIAERFVSAIKNPVATGFSFAKR
jgi:hypothetical protein